MNTSLYKYFPARPVFFDNFLIRATTKNALNDPFEVNPNTEYWVDMQIDNNPHISRDYARARISELYEKRQRELDYGFSLYRKYGIVSLTETADNLLMWSHYANEHKGFVVEFDVTHDFFTTMHTDGNEFVGSVNRVLYRKQRVERLGNYYLEPYFVKSDEWLYEKEHRLLLPIQKATRYMIDSQSADCSEIELKHPFALEKGEPEQSSRLKDIVSFEGASLSLDYPSVMCMFEIPKEAIKSVIFGCRCDASIIKTVTNKIELHGLDRVKLYKAKQDSHEFKLNFESIS